MLRPDAKALAFFFLSPVVLMVCLFVCLFGAVAAGTHVQTNEEVAIKLVSSLEAINLFRCSLSSFVVFTCIHWSVKILSFDVRSFDLG